MAATKRKAASSGAKRTTKSAKRKSTTKGRTSR
jgi:hypothetical protein